MSLIRTYPIMTIVEDHLNGLLPDPWVVFTDRAELNTQEVVLSSITTPRLQSFTMRGPDKASLVIQTTIRGRDADETRSAADLVREYLTGVDHRGKAMHPLTAEGFHFGVPTSWMDGRYYLNQGIHWWTESYRITWQYGRS